MTLIRPVVLKVGGSLFDWPELRRPWPPYSMTEGPRASTWLCWPEVAGRRTSSVMLDRTFTLGEVRAHHLALRSLDLTAHVLAALVAGLVVVEELATLKPVRLLLPWCRRDFFHILNNYGAFDRTVSAYVLIPDGVRLYRQDVLAYPGRRDFVIFILLGAEEDVWDLLGKKKPKRHFKGGERINGL